MGKCESARVCSFLYVDVIMKKIVNVVDITVMSLNFLSKTKKNNARVTELQQNCIFQKIWAFLVLQK